jgi:RNA recognition motif-containing protein
MNRVDTMLPSNSPSPRGGGKFTGGPEIASGGKLFVGQIPKDVDENTLKKYFDDCGPIIEVMIIRDSVTRVSKGALLFYLRQIRLQHHI